MIGVLNCYGLPEEDNEDNYIINEEDEFEGKVGEQWLIKRRKALKDYNWGWVCFNGDIEDYEYNFAKMNIITEMTEKGPTVDSLTSHDGIFHYPKSYIPLSNLDLEGMLFNLKNRKSEVSLHENILNQSINEKGDSNLRQHVFNS